MVFTMILALGGELLAASAAPDFQRAFDEPLLAREPAPLEAPALQPVEQLTNKKTGVTCTMQILRARPADPKAVRPAPRSVDPGIRGDVSPCLE